MRKLQGTGRKVAGYKSAFRSLKSFCAKPVRLFDGFDDCGTQFRCLMRHNFLKNYASQHKLKYRAKFDSLCLNLTNGFQNLKSAFAQKVRPGSRT